MWHSEKLLLLLLLLNVAKIELKNHSFSLNFWWKSWSLIFKNSTLHSFLQVIVLLKSLRCNLTVNKYALKSDKQLKKYQKAILT